MINKSLIQNRLSLLDAYLKELKEIAKMERTSFLSSPVFSAAAESYLRRSLECIFDIGRHILAKTGNIDLATEYKSIAKGLGEKGIIDAALTEKMIMMAGYRNRIVHMYNEINNEELYDILTNDLQDLEKFKAEIKSYLQQF